MEHDEQKMLVNWFRLQYPRLRPLLFAIPNGSVLAGYDAEKRGRHMQWLIDEGFAQGLPDLFLAYPIGRLHGLFIEMKDKGRTRSALTLDQRQYLQRFWEAGYGAAWAAGFDQARAVVDSYLGGKFDGNEYLEHGR